MKYKRALHFLNIVIFSSLWFLDNSKYISIVEKINDPVILCTRLMNASGGYNDSIFRVGIVLTVLFSASFFSNFKQDSSLKVLMYGRENFVFASAKNVAIFSFLFSVEFWGIDVFLTTIFCELKLLIKYQYFICSIFYFITRFLYFLLCGIVLLLIKLSLDFKKQYIYVGCLSIIALNSLPYLMIDKGIILFSDFINNWMINAQFNYFEYIRNVTICLLLIAILILLSKMVFLKKDILIYEEEI